ncbi:MAG: anti-sigma factor [Actinomycetota bacterium]|nr:anti-sigma factor [Actinomycetota bacterium]
MSVERSHEELKALVAPYALGAVPADEIDVIRMHIVGCDECTAELESIQAAVEDLAFAVEPVPLPPGFAERVMAQVGAERSLEAVGARPKRRFSFSLGPALAAAALLLATAVMAALFFDARSDLASSKRLSAALWRTRGDITLSGPGRASAKMLTTTDGGMVFVSRGLAEAAEGRDYQLWLMRGSCAEVADPACEKISAGTFEVKEGVAIIRSPDSLEGFQRAAVTVERDGGAQQPTTNPVLLSA